MTPIEALESGMASILLSSSLKPRQDGKPGEVVQKLSAKTRAALAGLTSDMIADVAQWRVNYFCWQRPWLDYVGMSAAELAALDERLIRRQRYYDPQYICGMHVPRSFNR